METPLKKYTHLVKELFSESQHPVSQDQENENTARDDESIAPHTVLVHQDIDVHGRAKAQQENTRTHYDGCRDTTNWRERERERV